MKNNTIQNKPISFYTAWDDFRLVCRKQLHSTPKNTPKEHSHRDFYELVTVASGTALHRVDGMEFPISAGSVFLIHPGQQHYYIDYDNLEIYNLLFSRRFVRLCLPDLSALEGYQLLFNTRHKEENAPGGIRLKEEFFPETIRLLEKMDKLNQDQHPGDKAMLMSDFIRVMLLFSRHLHWSGTSGKVNHTGELTGLLSELEKNFSAHWDLEKMAKSCRMSVSGFRQEFGRLTGKPPIAYLLELRLQKSALLLETGNMPLSDVAVSCGFSDPNYFARQFKKFFGIQPGRYRRECIAGGHPWANFSSSGK